MSVVCVLLLLKEFDTEHFVIFARYAVTGFVCHLLGHRRWYSVNWVICRRHWTNVIQADAGLYWACSGVCCTFV